MDQPTLFDLPPVPPPLPEAPPIRRPRLRTAERSQVVMRILSLDQMLPHDDEARTVWAFVEQCDLSDLLAEIRALEGHVGRSATDPRILLALWLFATLRGVGSARELARLCERHLSYQWLCGDVSLNYHTLADFRVTHAATRDRLLTEQIAALMQAGAVQFEARNMKMADGGYRPAYNVQFSTDVDSQVIVGVDVTNQGTDAGQLTPLVAQIEKRTGVRPVEVLADGGFMTVDDIQTLNRPEQGYQVYVPVKKEEQLKAKGEDPFAPRPDESPELTEWRTRMGTEEAKTIYKDRAATAECVNALARQRGLQQFNVRGLVKTRTIGLWYALAHNLRRWATLCGVIPLSPAVQ